MGYRSDISISLKVDNLKAKLVLDAGFEDLPAWLRTSIKQNGDWEVTELDDTTLNFRSKASFKWYESYPEVGEIVKYLAQLDSEEYHFLRVGDDAGDIERGGYLEDDLYPETTIVRY